MLVLVAVWRQVRVSDGRPGVGHRKVWPRLSVRRGNREGH